MKREDNPIIAAAKRGLREERQFIVILGKWDEQRPEEQRDILRRLFTDEAIYEIGCLILGALVAGDKQMVLSVRDAIKEAERTFGRNLEKGLFEKALRYTLCNWRVLWFKHRGDSRRAVDELKRGIEQHCNKGHELAQYRWSRLRLALELPKRSCVRHDRKLVKLGKVEIIDLEPSPSKKRRRITSSTKQRKTEY